MNRNLHLTTRKKAMKRDYVLTDFIEFPDLRRSEKCLLRRRQGWNFQYRVYIRNDQIFNFLISSFFLAVFYYLWHMLVICQTNDFLSFPLFWHIFHWHFPSLFIDVDDCFCHQKTLSPFQTKSIAMNVARAAVTRCDCLHTIPLAKMKWTCCRLTIKRKSNIKNVTFNTQITCNQLKFMKMNFIWTPKATKKNWLKNDTKTVVLQLKLLHSRINCWTFHFHFRA